MNCQHQNGFAAIAERCTTKALAYKLRGYDREYEVYTRAARLARYWADRVRLYEDGLGCPCCGDVGAVPDSSGYFIDGQDTICGCGGWVSCDTETPAEITLPEGEGECVACAKREHDRDAYARGYADAEREHGGRVREGRELLRRFVKYVSEDRAETPGSTRLSRHTAAVTDYLRRTHNPRDLLRSDPAAHAGEHGRDHAAASLSGSG